MERTVPRTSTEAQRFRCECGKSFHTERGMKCHRTKMGCLTLTSRVERTEKSDKSSGELCQVANHSAENAHVTSVEKDSISPEERRPRVNFPAAGKKAEWKTLDEELVNKLVPVITSECSVDRMLVRFTDTIYLHCTTQFGVKETKTNFPQPKKNRRQRKMEAIRNRKNRLRKQWRKAPEAEKAGLKSIWEELKKEHSRLRKAEKARMRRSSQMRSRRRFFKDPFGFSKALFEQPRSGTLEADKTELEAHLRKTYTKNTGNRPLPNLDGLVWPGQPGVKFNARKPTSNEVAKTIQKARSRSAPGPNGIPFTLYKRCPGTRQLLVNVLQLAWSRRVVCKEWKKAEGIYIPKEQNSKSINQFRPISLLNVEGKIFFAILAKRLTDYLTTNGFVDTSVQKGGVPGVPGCLEHSTMIWEAIQRAKAERRDLHVIWLDLANAYGSVPHQLIWLALQMYHIPRPMVKLLQAYFSDFMMRFSTTRYTTQWIPLEVGIAMGCTVSPILFVLVMQVILRAAESRCSGADLGGGLHMPPLKAFMDDTTILASQETEARSIMDRLQQVITWAGMKFKPQKSRSLSLKKGKVSPNLMFTIDEEAIPTVSQQPVKSLGRVYDASLKDSARARETKEATLAGLARIDGCGLQGRYKIWIFQHILLPKLLWPLLVYEVCLSTVESIEATISKFLRRWLGVPPGFSNTGLYGRSTKLCLPLKSISEGFKVGKVRLNMMLQTSNDPLVRLTVPTLRTGRKWRVQKAVDEAIESLKTREVLGHVQTGKEGLGWGEGTQLWSRADEKGKRELVIQEIQATEEAKRTTTAVQQAQQGQWTTWESVMQRTLTWKDIWHMAPLRLAFIIRATYDLLPTNANLAKWGKVEDPSCQLCGKKQTLTHVLAGCAVALGLGRYTWRHNRVLTHLAEAVGTAIEEANKTTPAAKGPMKFVREGDRAWSIESRGKPPSLLDHAQDWKMAMDLKGSSHPYPQEIKETGQRPDIVVYSRTAKSFILLELTVPLENSMDEWHQIKLAKYQPLTEHLASGGFRATVLAAEIGARGFVGYSAHKVCKKLGLPMRQTTRYLRAMSEAAERASCWIWMKRDTKEGGASGGSQGISQGV